jgi:DNA topoisomerase I
MNVVVVESPAKAKTINKYLGKDYVVLASYGHVRDLPAKDGSVRPDDDFSMLWEVEGKGEKRLKDILAALKGADHLFLATDPDREGEAISWHVQEVLKNRHALKGIDVKRVVFNEVTKTAVLEAFRHPRELNQELVEAYLARRALDYLVGFTLSPVLWRKLPGSRSAGRVQSVALRLICEREAEIEAFKPREYWSIEVDFLTPSGQTVTARLTHLDGKRLDKFSLTNEADARAAAAAIQGAPGFSVIEIERRQAKRHPQPPFTTSTLQQEASRKLGFGASRTMSLAQRLYEGAEIDGDTVGLITYMRTDGVTLSNDALAATAELIEKDYGKDYRPAQPRIYKSQAKNAQEAHEAIRPTDLFRRPDSLGRSLETDQHRLYELIWKRTVASQMESAILDQVAVDIASPDRKLVFRATGSVVQFDGFLKLYQEDRDDVADDEEEGKRLPAMKEGEAMARHAVKPDQHFTQPPPRYSEASLVKKLEELGIGRPSTYASIIQVLQDRTYVKIDKKRFVPEDRGRLVTAFLGSFFDWLVEYNFTADLENQLDDVSGGRIDWKKVLRQFWAQFSTAIEGTKDLTITQVIATLDEELGRHFFPEAAGGRDPRLCPSCNAGRLGLKLGKFGAFIGCANYPECKYTRPLAIEPNGTGEGGDAMDAGPKELGIDPETELPVTLRKGPYGIYVQLGEGDKEVKPKRVSLPRGLTPADVDLDTALRLLALPREIGRHPEGGETIVAGIGRFGPYLKHAGAFKSLTAEDDILTIGLNRAVVLLAEPSKGRRGAPTPLRTLGNHPDDGEPVALFKGRYGPYVSHSGLIASLPRDMSPDDITLEAALPLLQAQEAKGKKRKKPPAAKKATDGAAKKAPAKKPAKKKAAARKPAKSATKSAKREAVAAAQPAAAEKPQPKLVKRTAAE